MGINVPLPLTGQLQGSVWCCSGLLGLLWYLCQLPRYVMYMNIIFLWIPVVNFRGRNYRDIPHPPPWLFAPSFGIMINMVSSAHVHVPPPKIWGFRILPWLIKTGAKESSTINYDYVHYIHLLLSQDIGRSYIRATVEYYDRRSLLAWLYTGELVWLYASVYSCTHIDLHKRPTPQHASSTPNPPFADNTEEVWRAS